MGRDLERTVVPGMGEHPCGTVCRSGGVLGSPGHVATLRRAGVCWLDALSCGGAIKWWPSLLSHVWTLDKSGV